MMLPATSQTPAPQRGGSVGDGSGSGRGLLPVKTLRSTPKREVIMIDSDGERESDIESDAHGGGVAKVVPSDPRNNHNKQLSFRSAREHESVSSYKANGILPRVVDHAGTTRPSQQQAVKMPAVSQGTPAARYHLPVPAVKASLMRPRLGSTPVYPASAHVPRSDPTIKHGYSSSPYSREPGQKKLDTYMNPVTPQPTKPTTTVASSASTKSAPAYASTTPRRRDGVAPSRTLAQRIFVEPKELHTPRPNTQKRVDLGDSRIASAHRAFSAPKSLRVKEEPVSSSHTNNVFKNGVPPHTPSRPLASNRSRAPGSAPSSAGTSIQDPYNISSDSGSDSDDDGDGDETLVDSNRDRYRLRSFSDINRSPSPNKGTVATVTGQEAADQVASSPWTENFMKRESSVEAVLRECQQELLDDSPIPISIPGPTTRNDNSWRQGHEQRYARTRARADRPQGQNQTLQGRGQIQDHQSGDRKRPCLKGYTDGVAIATPSPLKRTVNFAHVEAADDDEHKKDYKHERKRVETEVDRDYDTVATTIKKEAAECKLEKGIAEASAEGAWLKNRNKKMKRTHKRVPPPRPLPLPLSPRSRKRESRHRNRDRKAWRARKKQKKRKREGRS
ncbi:hypothetical protein F5Y17DRAFT_23835 [Xylariaceae sp. FL0594]|nr:hypothetical protein F5Y17DRAFT_23835 [Xylariaceae sp. FL0594]